MALAWCTLVPHLPDISSPQYLISLIPFAFSAQRIHCTTLATLLAENPWHKLRPSFDDTPGGSSTRAVIQTMSVWQMCESAVKTMEEFRKSTYAASDAASAKHKEELATAVA